MANWHKSFIKHMVQDIIKEYPGIEKHIKGCTAEDLEQLKKAQGVNFLPAIYEEFMLAMGRTEPRSFPQWTPEWTIPNLSKMNWKINSLKPDAYFFWVYFPDFHGFFFHTADQNDNPPVYVMSEDNQVAGKFERIWWADNFSEGLVHHFAPKDNEENQESG